jgi:F0F1-type ATP synthase assembly protein I
MTAALLLGAFAGRWLDDRLGTEPLLLVLGLLLGTVLGLWEIARVALLQTSDGAGGGRDDER